MFRDKSSNVLREELKDLNENKYNGWLIMGIPGLNFIGLMDMDEKEKKIKGIEEELKSRGEDAGNDFSIF
jgi:hypothetical protein